MNKLTSLLYAKSKLVAFLFIFLIPLILVMIWFKDGYILGAAEAEIPFYHLQRPADITLWAWTDIQLGYVSSFIVASNPTWSFLAWVQDLGVKGFIIQAGVFWLLFATAGLGTYFLTKELFEDIHPLASFSAVLFYWFNPISLANIWNRFLYNFMCFFALLPPALFLFLKGMLRKNYLYAFWVNLTILILSFALTSYVFNLLIWFSFLYTTIFYSVLSKNKKTVFFNFKFFFLTLILFLLFNCWWLLPTFNLFSSPDTRSVLTSDVFTTEGNLITLDKLSQKLGNLIDLIRFMHAGFYNGEGPAWSKIYNNWFASMPLFGFSAIILWIILHFRKQKNVLYLSALFVAALFLAKGSNPPFGEVFRFLFKNVVFLQVFRNPYEKFGFLLALVAAPLFGYGLHTLCKSYQKFNILIYPAILVIVITILGYPFFSSLVFTGPNYPNNNYSVGYKVAIPDYYKDADSWLLSQGSNFRFIGFPLGGEGITYNWDKGYQGVEASNTLFSVSSILFNTGGWSYYYQLVGKLEELLFKENNFHKIANAINAKFLMLRSDIDFYERGMRNPNSIRQRLKLIENLGTIKEESKFGNLNFWKNLTWEDKTVYASSNLIKATPKAVIDDILLQEVDDRTTVYDNDKNINADNLTSLEILHAIEVPDFDLISRSRKYQFAIEDEGEYDLILTNTSWMKYKQTNLLDGLKLTIDGNFASHSASSREDNRVGLGTYKLNKGLYEFIFILPEAFKAVANFVEAPEHFSINDTNKQFMVDINDFDTYSKYYASFYFLMKKGKGFYFGIDQQNERNIKKPLFSQFVPYDPKFPDFRQVSGIFPLGSTPEKARFFISGDLGESSEVELKNLFITKVPEFSPILRKTRSNTEPTIPPRVTYKKYNPSKYSVQISEARGNFVLVLSQLYNPGWRAKYQDGEIIKKHLLVNAFANGWVIERNGDQTITLEFSPQKLLDIGKTVSSLSVIGALIYIVSILFRKKIKLWK